jgi:thymidine kinase
MFNEEKPYHQNINGWVEVITGPMFSGKTEELIRRLKRAQLAKQKVEIFKPSIDKRFSENDIVSHNSNSLNSIPVKNASDILTYISSTSVVGIDEAQFFDENVVNVCNDLANNGIRVIIAGLDMDFRGNPFGSIPALTAIAEFVSKLSAVCMDCGQAAYFSYRKSSNDKLIFLGEKDEYEPLCRSCFNKKLVNDKV